MEPAGSVDIVDALSLNAFKNSLSRIRDKQMGFFVDWVR